jgi:tetratricopeptide (TPR) repeat protein
MEDLGASYNAEPFWRRLQDSFNYPLNTETAILIIGVAFLTTIVSFIPFAIIWHLILFGAFMKYCFCCLEKTSMGSFKAPDITAAYDGGIVIALQLIAMVAIIAGIIISAHIWLGVGIASLLAGVIICCVPAILINFALSESIFDAINPLKVVYLVSAIGLPYGLLLALIMVMLGSVEIINQIIGNEFSILTTSLQSAASNYYTIVIFHLMGYMIFQYQGKLGFIAREDESANNKKRSDVERILTKIEIHVKEGDYNKATKLFQVAMKENPNNKDIYNKCFDFLLAIKNKKLIEDYSKFYFKFLKDVDREDQLTIAYKKMRRAHPKFVPITADDRLMLAREFRNSGDSLTTVKLLNGIQNKHPDFKHLADAYRLTAEALTDIPSMADQAKRFTLLADRHEQAQKQRTVKKRIPKAFDLSDNKNNLPAETPKDNSDINYDGGIDFN